jgi:hypothetical protein
MVSIGIIFKIDIENFERKYHLKSKGFNFEKVLSRYWPSGNIKRPLRLAVCSVSKNFATRSEFNG